MAWAVTFYRSDAGTVPAREFLTSCPTNVRRKLLVILEVVRVAPPPSFSGGGMWEAMHGTMNGYYEIRVTGPGRRHYRLYCILDNGTKSELTERGFDGPHIVVLNGLVKPNASLFSDGDYRRHVRKLGEHYRSTLPRPVAA
jgi:hypothetical protein